MDAFNITDSTCWWFDYLFGASLRAFRKIIFLRHFAAIFASIRRIASFA